MVQDNMAYLFVCVCVWYPKHNIVKLVSTESDEKLDLQPIPLRPTSTLKKCPHPSVPTLTNKKRPRDHLVIGAQNLGQGQVFRSKTQARLFTFKNVQCN